MISAGLLMRLAVKEAKLRVRGVALKDESRAALEAFIEAATSGASREVIEAARLRCASVYEMQLDLIIETATHQRAWKEATGEH